jgi:hypothetical protein
VPLLGVCGRCPDAMTYPGVLPLFPPGKPRNTEDSPILVEG